METIENYEHFKILEYITETLRLSKHYEKNGALIVEIIKLIKRIIYMKTKLKELSVKLNKTSIASLKVKINETIDIVNKVSIKKIK